jgi:hypothetical protein
MKTGIDDGSLHLKVLSRFKDLLKKMHSNKTCFACLAEIAENTLSCHHAICDCCVMAHGQSSDAEPWTFFVRKCPLCGELNSNVFVQKPYTAGVRAIIVEGGGVRGIYPLTFLFELERAIDLPMGIQEHFDLACGSSSGKSIIELRRSIY